MSTISQDDSERPSGNEVPIKKISSADPEYVSVSDAARIAELNESQLTRYQALRKYPYAWFCVSVMIITLILTSFESQAGGIVISIPQFRKHFGDELPDGSFVIEAKWQSTFSGVPLAAQMVGQWTGSYLCDKFGRKWVIWVAVLASFPFIGMEYAAETVQLFLAGKTLNGFCLGIMQPSAVAYVSEVAPISLKSTATVICNFTFVIAPMICFFINYFLAYKGPDDPMAYRTLFATQWGLAGLCLGLLLLVPESPTHLIVKGRDDDALKSYKKILRDDAAAEEHFSFVKMTVEDAKKISENSTYIDLFRGLNLKRTAVGSGVFLQHAFCGVYFTGNYTTYFFQLLGFDSRKSFRYTLGAQTISLTGCFFCMLFIDKLSRRNAVIWGTVALLINDILVGACSIPKNNEATLKATVAFMMLYGGVYNMLAGSLGYVCASENSTSALRAKTLAFGNSLQNVFNMMWSFVLPYLFNPDRANLGGKTMFIFAGCLVFFLIAFILFQTETRGRTFDEIDELFAARIPLRSFSKYKTRKDLLTERGDFEELEKQKSEVLHIEKA